jgi:hypothetical protein
MCVQVLSMSGEGGSAITRDWWLMCPVFGWALFLKRPGGEGPGTWPAGLWTRSLHSRVLQSHQATGVPMISEHTGQLSLEPRVVPCRGRQH